MAQFDVNGPDGHTVRVDAPEGATNEDAIRYAAANWNDLVTPNAKSDHPTPVSQLAEKALPATGMLTSPSTGQSTLPDQTVLDAYNKAAADQFGTKPVAQPAAPLANVNNVPPTKAKLAETQPMPLGEAMAQHPDVQNSYVAPASSYITEPAKAGWQGLVAATGHMAGGMLKTLGSMVDSPGTSNIGQWYSDNADKYLSGQTPASSEGMGTLGKFLIGGAQMAGGMVPLGPLAEAGGIPMIGTMFAAQSYQDRLASMRQSGASEPVAQKAALYDAALNAGMMGLMGVAGKVALGLSGTAKTATEAIKNMTDEQVAMPFIKNQLIGQGIAIPTMVAQGVGEQAITNEFQPNQGGNLTDAAIQSAESAAGYAGLVSPFGLLSRMAVAHNASKINGALLNGDAPVNERLAAASVVLTGLSHVDANYAEQWKYNSSLAIAMKSPIDARDDLLRLATGSTPKTPVTPDSTIANIHAATNVDDAIKAAQIELAKVSSRPEVQNGIDNGNVNIPSPESNAGQENPNGAPSPDALVLGVGVTRNEGRPESNIDNGQGVLPGAGNAESRGAVLPPESTGLQHGTTVLAATPNKGSLVITLVNPKTGEEYAIQKPSAGSLPERAPGKVGESGATGIQPSKQGTGSAETGNRNAQNVSTEKNAEAEKPVLNVGLNTEGIRGTGAPDQTEADVHAALKSMGVDVLKSTVREPHSPTDERKDVVTISRPLDAKELDTLADKTHQIAIPQTYRGKGLMNPKGEDAYGKYNPEYFDNHDGTHPDAEPLKDGEAWPLVGTHYSHEQRTELLGSKFGTGAAGEERARLAQLPNDDPRRTRIAVYIDEGNGTFPELQNGVGHVPHQIELSNLYDGIRNPLKFPTKDSNAFEKSVLDNGFDGYYVKNAFGTGKYQQGAAVLMGKAAERVVPIQKSVSPKIVQKLSTIDQISAAFNALPRGMQKAAQQMIERARQGKRGGLVLDSETNNIEHAANMLAKLHGTTPDTEKAKIENAIQPSRSEMVEAGRNSARVYVNPSDEQLQALLDKHRDLRSIADNNNNMLVWDAHQLVHEDVINHFGIDESQRVFQRYFQNIERAVDFAHQLANIRYADAGLQPIYASKSLNTKAADIASKVMPHLTPEERLQLRTNTAQKLVDLFDQLPPASEVAAVAYAGRFKKGWYRNSAAALVHVFGADAPRFSALLGAMSPQNSIQMNLTNALRTWKNWIAAGRPTDRQSIFEIMGRSVLGNKLTDSVLPSWIPNSVRALSSVDPTKLVLSGPKVSSFMKNLQGNVEEVTNDAWMANFFNVDQKLFSGSLNKEGTQPGKSPGYLSVSAKIRQAAKMLTRLTGEEWSPAEVQETVWSWAKTLAEHKGDGTLDEKIARSDITKELLDATPDFRNLLHEAGNEQTLHEAGYGEQIGSLRTRTDLNGAGAEAQNAGAEAAPFTPETQAKHERNAAKRLQLRQSEGTVTNGFYAPELGTSFIHTDNVRPEDVPAVVLHEIAHMANDDRLNAEVMNRLGVSAKIEASKGIQKSVYDQEGKEIMYSPLQRAVEGLKQDKASPDQWIGIIKNMKGISKEELEHTGILDMLENLKQAPDYYRAFDKDGQIVATSSRELHVGGVYAKVEKVNPSKTFYKEDIADWLKDGEHAITVKPKIYGYGAEGGNVVSEFEFSHGNYETNEPDMDWLQEQANSRALEEMDNLKGNDAQEERQRMQQEVYDNVGLYENGEEVPVEGITDAHILDYLQDKYLKEEESDYWADSDSPASKEINVTAGGANYTFNVSHSYGEVYITDGNNGNYVASLSGRGADEASQESAIREYMENTYDVHEGEDADATKFEGYSLPGGGNNYRERLLLNKNSKQEPFEYTNHFNDQNIIAHTRVNDRVVPADNIASTFPALAAKLKDEGRQAKIYFMEEMQSDWAQQGREKPEIDMRYKPEDLHVNEVESAGDADTLKDLVVKSDHDERGSLVYYVVNKARDNVKYPDDYIASNTYHTLGEAEHKRLILAAADKWVITSPDNSFSVSKRDHPTREDALQYIIDNNTRRAPGTVNAFDAQRKRNEINAELDKLHHQLIEQRDKQYTDEEVRPDDIQNNQDLKLGGKIYTVKQVASADNGMNAAELAAHPNIARAAERFSILDSTGRTVKNDVLDLSGVTRETATDLLNQYFRAKDTAVEQSLNTTIERMTELRSEMRNLPQGLPKGPYVEHTDSWVALAIKDAIHEAVKGGYDLVSWTTGDQQTARWSYGLRKQVDTINWVKKDNGKIGIVALKGNQVKREVANTEYSPHDLAAAIGKTMADKIISSEEKSGSITGNNIKVADLGMIKFYGDSHGNDPSGKPAIVTKVANKVLKQLGGDTVKQAYVGGNELRFAKYDEKYVANQPTFEITDKMREGALAGQPMFSKQAPASGDIYSRVRQRMEAAGETGNAKEATSYLVEEAMKMGQTAGHSRLDTGFWAWAQKMLPQSVVSTLKQWVANVRAAMFKHGVILKESDLSIDDFVAIAKSNMRDLASGKMEAAGGIQAASKEPTETLYRGNSIYNKNGSFYSSDPEWARQFTQSGRHSEVSKVQVKQSDIYTAPELKYAGDDDLLEQAITDAKTRGFKAVRMSEGRGQPSSVFVFNKSALKPVGRWSEQEANQIQLSKSKLVTQTQLAAQQQKTAPQRITDSIKDAAKRITDNLVGLKDAWSKDKTLTDTHRIILKMTGDYQRIDLDLSHTAKLINDQFPDDRQRAITHYMQAGGDMTELAKRESAIKASNAPANLKAEFQNALNLTPAEKHMADTIRDDQEKNWAIANQLGVVEGHVDNYVRGQWERENIYGDRINAIANSGMLNTKPKEAMQKVFQNYYEGIMAGFVPTDTRIGFQYVAGQRSIRRAIAARSALEQLMNAKEKDGKPTIVIGASGRTTEKQDGSKAYFVSPNVSDKDFDYTLYKPYNHSAMRGWKWVGKDVDDNPIFMQGNAFVHKDSYGRINALLGTSKIREWTIPESVPVIGGTRPGNAALKAGAYIKATILTGTPFHQFHLGEHAAFFGVNPTNLPPVDFAKRPLLSEGVDLGLMISNHNAMHEFGEGLAGGGLVSHVPYVGAAVHRYGEYLFGDYIPRAKAAVFEAVATRDLKRLAPDIASGKLTREQVIYNAANQANYAFGELNFRAMGRNPTMQDALRLSLLAPDFFESRIRSSGMTLSKHGNAQRNAIIAGAAIMSLSAQAINTIFGDNKKPDWSKPFTVTIGGRDYTPRSEIGDIAHLVTDPRSFFYNRLNPLWGKPMTELMAGRDQSGQKETLTTAMTNIVKSWTPIPAQGLVKNNTGQTMTQSIVGSLLQSVGISNYQTKSDAERMISDISFNHRPLGGDSERQAKHYNDFVEIKDDYQVGKLNSMDDVLKKAKEDNLILTKGMMAQIVSSRDTSPEGKVRTMQAKMKSFTADEVLQVYNAMSQDERNTFKGFAQRKVIGAKDISPQERVDALAEIQKLSKK